MRLDYDRFKDCIDRLENQYRLDIKYSQGMSRLLGSDTIGPYDNSLLFDLVVDMLCDGSDAIDEVKQEIENFLWFKDFGKGNGDDVLALWERICIIEGGSSSLQDVLRNVTTPQDFALNGPEHMDEVIGRCDGCDFPCEEHSKVCEDHRRYEKEQLRYRDLIRESLEMARPSNTDLVPKEDAIELDESLLGSENIYYPEVKSKISSNTLRLSSNLRACYNGIYYDLFIAHEYIVSNGSICTSDVADFYKRCYMLLCFFEPDIMQEISENQYPEVERLKAIYNGK